MTIPGPASQYYVSQRMKLHYADWGNPDAPPLLLVHGGRDHCRNWDWTAQALARDWHIIAVDLRGHGDSAWAQDGNYAMQDMVYDVARLVDLLGLAPITIVAHSMGGHVALRYAGLFPEKVARLVAIEGLGPSPKLIEAFDAKPLADHIRDWMDKKAAAAARTPRRYATLDEALARMQEENSYLSAEQAHHLTLHGVNRNEDGSYSWKFDPHLNFISPFDIPRSEIYRLFGAITCPTLLLYGADSWASNPVTDGRMLHFGPNARVETFEKAGHWLHHDQFERFIGTLREFL